MVTGYSRRRLGWRLTARCAFGNCDAMQPSRSFYRTFEMTRPATQGHKIYDLDDGLWDIPELRLLLEKIVPEHEVMEGFEVERDFPRIGRRTMLLNARKVFYEGNGQTTILLAFEDTTELQDRARPAKAAGAEGDA